MLGPPAAAPAGDGESYPSLSTVSPHPLRRVDLLCHSSSLKLTLLRIPPKKAHSDDSQAALTQPGQHMDLTTAISKDPFSIKCPAQRLGLGGTAQPVVGGSNAEERREVGTCRCEVGG